MLIPQIKRQGGDTTAVAAAGLPNIEGAYWGRGIEYSSAGDNASGAFTAKPKYDEYSWGHADAGNTILFLFDASKYNSIYGASTTVQPPAIQLIPQIKY